MIVATSNNGNQYLVNEWDTHGKHFVPIIAQYLVKTTIKREKRLRCDCPKSRLIHISSLSELAERFPKLFIDLL